ncbi:type IV secretory system conjugative DNA transfer family protein [Sphingomonas sp. LB-2]|uniref:type IV secretory system conjugative DNA transfer family protein n=1 Tax=Sphingomonas caeni TaxID=2984949 RepID=UPI002231D1FF|nr:type IV secretory system conjugative DNA transfer family protein [Sphingomonas caeni]MCW3847377.1 type IV secretory system conjugative DNA transfer family protein [Sphingomonas caeni]
MTARLSGKSKRPREFTIWAAALLILCELACTLFARISARPDFWYDLPLWWYLAVFTAPTLIAWAMPVAWYALGRRWRDRFTPSRKLKSALLSVAVHLVSAFCQAYLFDARGYAVALLSAAGFSLGLYRIDWFAEPSLPPSTVHGSAQWATFDYLRLRGLIGGDGLMVGFVADEGAGLETLRYNGDRHLLTFAPTRWGKGTTMIVPNLLIYGGSAIVIDPKGENALITAQARAAMGQEIHVVDPWGIAAGWGGGISRFNPLDWLVPGDPDMAENAMILADALVAKEGAGDPFWNEEAKALLHGLILYVATDAEEAGSRHLGRVRELLLLDGEDMPALFQRMYESPHRVVASAGARSLQKDEKLLASVVSSAQAHTHFLDSPRLLDSLSASDFDFAELKARKITVYLVLPSDRLETFSRWLRLLIQQALTVNARNIEIQPDKPILFMLDELASLGRLAAIKTAYGLMAGYGMQLWGVVQDATQLRDLYGEGWETFISNAGAVQYFGSRDRLSSEYFSALCGQATVTNLSMTFSRSTTWTKDGCSSTSGTSTTWSHVQRKLAFPDELARLDRGRQLVLIENHNPILAQRLPWFDDPKLKLLGRNLHLEQRSEPTCPIPAILPSSASISLVERA